ncbi:MAG TPA: glycosyltransferase [Candidatus Methylomirabilis sp.]|nr:glycosyltransferase [Candidatus Methylomirabilis sp.]
MLTLRIVIVAWNVEQLLDRCLRSLPGSCSGLDWDCVVVDNASKDGSVAVAMDVPNVRVIANRDNRGFAKACNQGLAGVDARYVLLLNPDTECPPDSLTRLVRAADNRDRAGIVGPKLLNSDGSVQTSIRRFPTFWSQFGIMLKLHNLFPALFLRYFATDQSLEAEQDVDQVMGSCFLIRREVLEQIGGLDERYFIWFEEVDYCRMAREHGWNVRYIPSVAVTHHGGQSFGQVFTRTKQRYFNDSLVSYFRKWEPGWKPWVLNLVMPLSLALAYAAGVLGFGSHGSVRTLSRRSTAATGGTWKTWVAVVVGTELVSALTIFQPIWNSSATLIVAFIVGLLAWKRPTLALAVLLMELMIGSKGYVLQLGAWPDAVSLRIVFFIIFLFGWMVNVAQSGAWRGFPRLFRGRIEWALLFVLVGYAALRGAMLGNAYVVADGNAWGFLLLLIPVLELASRMGDRLRKDVLPVLFVAPVWLAVKTLGLEYVFSHGFTSLSQPAYLWVRRTGVGEVTLITANAFRIFMQSYIFALPALFFGASWYFATHEKGLRQNRVADILTLSALVVLAISLSRSMWIGAAAGMMTLLVFVVAGRPPSAEYIPRGTEGLGAGSGSLVQQREGVRPGAWPARQMWRGFGRLVMLGVASLALIFVTLAFPIPRVDVASLATLFGSRLSTDDAAARSRWTLLPAVWEKIQQHPILGSGFGATVTYTSFDPRLVAQSGGVVTTYAFEWGWLEHWVKFGIGGLLVMLLIVWRLGRRIARMDEPRWMVVAGIATVVGLAVTHFFTPYLNHPLGFALLFLGEGWIASRRGLDQTTDA